MKLKWHICDAMWCASRVFDNNSTRVIILSEWAR